MLRVPPLPTYIPSMSTWNQPYPDWIRVAHDFDWATSHDLGIVHVGQSGTVLAAPQTSRRTLVAVTWGDRGLVPGGVEIPVCYALHLLGHIRLAAGAGKSVDLSEWQALPIDRRAVVDLRLPHIELDVAAVHQLQLLLHDHGAVLRFPDTAMDPSRQRTLAPALADAIITGDTATCEVLVERLMGAGPGATPAGDDVLVGVLAGARLATWNELLDHGAQNAHQSVRSSVVRLLDRTTEASRHDLAAAIAGSFSQRFLLLVAALGDPLAVRTAHRAAQTWGATSGIDLLHGLVAMTARALDQPPAQLRPTA